MELYLNRIVSTDLSTLGVWIENGKAFGFSIEDAKHPVKIAGKTRIPAGRYKMSLYKVLSPKTILKRQKFAWFTWFIQLENVPGFEAIHIHEINTPEDTEGCVGMAYNAHIVPATLELAMDGSVPCVQKFYAKYVPMLELGDDVWLNVNDPK